MQKRKLKTFASLATAIAAAGLGIFASSAKAISIELKDAGNDRVERQRAAAEGRLPLPDTPDVTRLAERLDAKGLRLGSQLFIRIFKSESELEVWFRKDNTYTHFATYPICHWSGGLGPKLRQGDKQSPEGFYSLTRRNLHRAGRWPQALNLGYPNAFDRSQARSGSYILVHGGCSSVGCFAMTNPVMAEIYRLATSALQGGQRHIPIHIFPFRMTDANVVSHASSTWKDFWSNLKEGYDAFERTQRPPRVGVCRSRYRFEDPSPLEARDPGPIELCQETADTIRVLDRLENLLGSHRLYQLLTSLSVSTITSPGSALARLSTVAAPGPIVDPSATSDTIAKSRHAASRTRNCNLTLPSCRRFIALHERRITKRAWASKSTTRTRHRGT